MCLWLEWCLGSTQFLAIVLLVPRASFAFLEMLATWSPLSLLLWPSREVSVL